MTLRFLLQGVAWVLFAIAALAFWMGGWAISEFGKTERLLAEMEGMGLVLVLGGLGFLAKSAGEDLAESEEGGASTSEDDSVRK